MGNAKKSAFPTPYPQSLGKLEKKSFPQSLGKISVPPILRTIPQSIIIIGIIFKRKDRKTYQVLIKNIFL